jgi:tetrathionate reductase subunit B
MAKALIVDVTLCNGCHNCQIACKDEYVENDWPPYSAAQPDTGHFWMKTNEIVRGTVPKVKVAYVPTPCMQCDTAPCMKAATGEAIYKRDDGIVIIDAVKSKGQKQIVDACPYGVIYWNDTTGIPQKCTFCAHLLDRGWKEPRCVEACPTGALMFGEYEDLKATIQQKGALPLNPEYGTQPRVYYRGVPKKFIAGALVDSKTGECLNGADVTVKDTATGTTTAGKSDNYGDFWFDGLDANKSYEVTISATGKTSKTISVTLTTDTNLGDIQL